MPEPRAATVPRVDEAPDQGRALRADARRNLEAILAAAQQLLPEEPDVSMGHIAAAAGVHRATVHRHFASRDELVAAVRARAMDASVVATSEVLGRTFEHAADRIEAITAAMLAAGDRYRLYRFTTWRDEHTLDRSRELGEVMVPLLAASQREGDLRSDIDPERLLVAYGGLIVAVLPEIAEGRMDPAEGAAFIRRMLASPAL